MPTAHTKNTNTVNAYLHDVYVDELHSTVFSGDRVSVKELTIGTSTGTGESSGASSDVVGGAVLVQGKVRWLLLLKFIIYYVLSA